MRIAVGNSRMDKKWKNKEMSWEDFKQKCSQTIRTTETISEYRKMSKPAQDNAKDVGGFVGGALKGGKRKNGFVEGRSLLTLDLDHAAPGVWDAITMLFDFKCLLYSTHKHTPGKYLRRNMRRYPEWLQRILVWSRWTIPAMKQPDLCIGLPPAAMESFCLRPRTDQC